MDIDHRYSTIDIEIDISGKSCHTAKRNNGPAPPQPSSVAYIMQLVVVAADIAIADHLAEADWERFVRSCKPAIAHNAEGNKPIRIGPMAQLTVQQASALWHK